MSVILGEVKGDMCPECREYLDLEGEFYQGQEVECPCGAVLEIAEVQAVYRVKMRTLIDCRVRIRTNPSPADEAEAIEHQYRFERWRRDPTTPAASGKMLRQDLGYYADERQHCPHCRG